MIKLTNKKVKILIFIILCAVAGGYFLSKGQHKKLFKNVSSYSVKQDPKLFKEITILTSSFDGYSELWGLHYDFLFKYWPSLLNEKAYIPLMLLTNELDFNHPRVQSLKIGQDTTWSRNMLKALENVKTKYVMIVLDDYYLHKKVNEPRLLELLTLLEHTNGAYVEISPDSAALSMDPEKKPAQGIDGVIIRHKDAKYRTSLQACIWNVEDLRKLLVAEENAWQFEGAGTKRSSTYPKPFYMLTDNFVMEYKNLVEKRYYRKENVKWVNEQGYEFNPTTFPVMTPEEIHHELIVKKKSG